MSVEADSRPEFEKDVVVFSTIDPRIVREKDQKKNILSPGEQKAVDDYKMMVLRLAHNRSPRFRNEGDRCRELDALTLKFRTGWPWQNNKKLVTYGTPQLIQLTEALSKRVLDVIKTQKRGDRTDTGVMS